MTTGSKVMIGVFVGGVLYLIISRRGSGAAPAAVSKSDADRVMQWSGYMMKSGAQEGIDPAVIAAIVHVESRGKADAMGGAGEIGLMQIMPSTGQWIAQVAKDQLRDPGTNIRAGTEYLRYCVDRKGGNLPAGIAGYNYGPDRITVSGNTVQGPQFVIRYMTDVLSLIGPYMVLFRERLGSFYENQFGDRNDLAGISLVNVINALYGATKIYVASRA